VTFKAYDDLLGQLTRSCSWCLTCRWLHLLDGLASSDSGTCGQVDWQTAFCHHWSASWCNGLDCSQHVLIHRSHHCVQLCLQ